jgi:Mimiviridae putative ATP-dependent RNA helicase
MTDSDNSDNSDSDNSDNSDSINITTGKVGILDPEGKYPNPLTGEEYSDKYKELGKFWSKFPAYEPAEQIIEDIKDHQVTLVVSGTGSGKTVLLPKFVLHSFGYDANIGITLPKKMITKSSAEFAADTLDVNLGQEVGYQYRGKSHKSDKTKLLYCTDGTMVARLISDPNLSDFNAVIIDEAHERKVNIDFLLYLLRNVLRDRPEFKVVIMSATIDLEIFKAYFSEFSFKAVEIGGKTNYPIESIFLNEKLDNKSKKYLEEGSKIIKRLMDQIMEEDEKTETEDVTGILFFVTSVSETQNICDTISNYDAESNVCISVYSGMDSNQEKLATDQDHYIQEYPAKDGKTKIKLVIATNVAESSLTIEGIKYVIDSGLELSSSYDGVNRVDILEKKLITHAQAKQRMGRTGRTGPGTCYHLYTKDDFESNMERFPIPAIRSDSITSEILRLMSMPNIETIQNVRKVLENFIEPPNSQTIDADVEYLTKMGMIENDKLTELGAAVVDLQLDPEEAKTMIMAYRLFVFREALAVITLSAACKHSISNLFTLPLDLLDESESATTDQHRSKMNWLNKKFNTAKSEYDNRYGDIVALLKIFYKYEELRENDRKVKTTASRKKLSDWMYESFLKEKTLRSAYDSYLRFKRRLRPTLMKLQNETSLIPQTDQKILDNSSTFRLLASFMYGYDQNEIRIKKGEAKIDYTDKLDETKPIKVEVDKISFVDLIKSKTSAKNAIYTTLFKFGDRPIKAKIVTYESEKSGEILKELE